MKLLGYAPKSFAEFIDIDCCNYYSLLFPYSTLTSEYPLLLQYRFLISNPSYNVNLKFFFTFILFRFFSQFWLFSNATPIEFCATKAMSYSRFHMQVAFIKTRIATSHKKFSSI